MKPLYRYRVEPLRWMFTDFLKSSATRRYDLYYHSVERRFQAEFRQRPTAHNAWSHPVICTSERSEELRAMLTPEDLARCAAASMILERTADADE